MPQGQALLRSATAKVAALKTISCLASIIRMASGHSEARPWLRCHPFICPASERSKNRAGAMPMSVSGISTIGAAKSAQSND